MQLIQRMTADGAAGRWFKIDIGAAFSIAINIPIMIDSELYARSNHSPGFPISNRKQACFILCQTCTSLPLLSRTTLQHERTFYNNLVHSVGRVPHSFQRLLVAGASSTARLEGNPF
jgi:hypothetical protein